MTEARIWVPGSAPCNGACDRDWALARMVEARIIPRAVQDVIVAGAASEVRFWLEDGDELLGMTYAINRRPQFSAEPHRASLGTMLYAADGYEARTGQTIWRVFEIRYCRNWSAMRWVESARRHRVPLPPRRRG